MTIDSSIRIGLFGARSDTGGLAAQTYDLYKFLKPHKTAVVVIDALTGYQSDLDLYKGAEYLYCPQFEPNFTQLDSFLRDLDVVICVETPYNHDLFSLARARGIKTVLQYNWEWLQHHQEPDLPKPDLFLAPSPWNQPQEIGGIPVKYLHVPIDRERFLFKGKHEAKKFLHIAGHRTMGDRNGTAILLEALPHIRSQIEIVIRTQDDLPRPYTDSKLTIIRDDVKDRRDIYQDEDVLILPRKYGGLSLQLNEAMSLGMVPLMPDIAPQNEFLMTESLIPAQLKEQQMIKTMIDVYECSPIDLALKIDQMASMSIEHLSKHSDAISHEKDWKNMKPQYEELLYELVNNNSHSE